MRRPALTFFILIFSFHAFSAYDFNENCINAFNKILCLRFEEGENLISIEKSKHPDNLIPYYIESYIDFITLMIGEDKDDYKNLKSQRDEKIGKLQHGDKSSPFYRYCLADVYMQWAMARFKFNDIIGCALDAKKAYGLLVENNKLFPSFIPNSKGLGLFHAGFGLAPEEAKWFMQIVSLEGTVEQGINEMKSVMEASFNNREYVWLRPESVFLLTLMQLNLISDDKKAMALRSQYEDNRLKDLVQSSPILVFSYANLLMRTGFNDKAIEILLKSPAGNGYFPFYYIKYLTGLAKLRRLDKDAFEYLFSYVLKYKGENYIKSAYQKIAWYYLIHGNEEKYHEYMKRIMIYGGTVVDGDKQALKEARSNEIPNIYLLKSRLLFDGGYYEAALDILLNTQKDKLVKDTRNEIEYNYRIGRIFHEWGKVSEAIPYYKETIVKGSRYSFYFAANASLQLGYIYESATDYDKARYYYKKCLSMNFNEYKNSIQAKAKAGLNRIRFK